MTEVSTGAEKLAGALVYGVVLGRDGSDLLLEVEGRRARLAASHSTPRDVVDEGATLACTVLDGDPSRPGELQVSRTQRVLLEGLMRRHIPAIRAGKVRIVRSARIAGYRSKVVVAAVKEGEDPIQAATRNRPGIKLVLKELGGEGLDIMPHADNVARLIVYLFDGRIEVLAVLIDEPSRKIEVTVPRGSPVRCFGQNVAQELELASRITELRVELRER